MTNWKSDELEKFGEAEEIQIAGLGNDGTLRKPVIIWVVRVGNDLYVRSVKGRNAGWFRGTQIQHEGSIWADGNQRDVTFVEENDPVVNELVDAAYLSKYRQYPQWVAPMVVAEVKGTTLKLVPR